MDRADWTAFEVSNGGYSLSVRAFLMGEDLLVSLSGGDQPHIGSAALAVPRRSLRDPAERSATSSVLNVVGHKDDALTKDASERLAAALGRRVVVVAGAHYENLDQSGIAVIRALGDRAVERLIASFGPAVAPDRHEG